MIPVTNELRDRVVAIVEAVGPEQVILFGSRTRDDAREASGVDLVVVESAPFGKTRSWRLEAARVCKALTDFDIPTDVLPYNRDEAEHWRSSTNHVLARALREGTMLYNRAGIRQRLMELEKT